MRLVAACCGLLRPVAPGGDVLRRVAACCSLLQPVAAFAAAPYRGWLHPVAACCGLLRLVAACCGVLRRVAACCRCGTCRPRAGSLMCVCVRARARVACWCALLYPLLWRATSCFASPAIRDFDPSHFDPSHFDPSHFDPSHARVPPPPLPRRDRPFASPGPCRRQRRVRECARRCAFICTCAQCCVIQRVGYT